MANKKASIVKKYTLSAKGILDISENGIGIENAETGEYVDMTSLLSDFADKSISLTVNYDEDYGSDAE